MPIILTPQQQQALASVEWLFSDNSRRTGRSFLIAVVVLRQMVRHPGEYIRVSDHIPGLRMSYLLYTKVLELVADLGIKLSEIDHAPGRLSMRLHTDYQVPDSVVKALAELGNMPENSSEPKITLWDILREADTPTEKDQFYCYIVESKLKNLYTGIAKDVQARVNKHNKGKGSKCLKGQLPVTLVWVSSGMSKSEASKLEYKIKQFSHSDKWRFIEKSLDIK